MACADLVDIEDSLSALNPPQKVVKPPPDLATPGSRQVDADSFVPGLHRVYVRTWGCSHNSSDSEYMAGLLAKAGYHVSYSGPDESDIWLLNSCTVKTPSEMALKNSIAEGLADGSRKVVVAGCVAQASPNTDFLRGLSLVGVQQIDRVVEVVEETLKGNTVRLLGAKRDGRTRLGGASLALPKIRRNPLIEILAINTGCLNHCTYCKTKLARGDLASYPIDELVERARTSFAEGVKEIWLTSEDLGAYGHDRDIRLPDLLTDLVPTIPPDCMLRLGMTNPPYVLDGLDPLADILNHDRVYSFLHVPVQSGSDRVLDDMKREYTVSDFCRVVDHLRDRVPGVYLATDLICGFPTETEDDFQETLDLVNRYRFPSLFINQYFPRPGTPAARMKRIDTKVTKDRTRRATAAFRAYTTYNADRVGQVERVLVTELAADGTHHVGHNKRYEQILVPRTDSAGKTTMGRWVDVRIVSTSKFSMTSELLTATPVSTRRALQLWLYIPTLASVAWFCFCFLSGASVDHQTVILLSISLMTAYLAFDWLFCRKF